MIEKGTHRKKILFAAIILEPFSQCFCYQLDQINDESKSSCGLYYKTMTIINDDSKVVNKLEASLTDGARVIFNDRHMFMVQATGVSRYLLVPVAGFEPPTLGL